MWPNYNEDDVEEQLNVHKKQTGLNTFWIEGITDIRMMDHLPNNQQNADQNDQYENLLEGVDENDFDYDIQQSEVVLVFLKSKIFEILDHDAKETIKSFPYFIEYGTEEYQITKEIIDTCDDDSYLDSNDSNDSASETQTKAKRVNLNSNLNSNSNSKYKNLLFTRILEKAPKTN